MKKEIPKEIKDLLDATAKQYSESPATSDGGRVLRFFARFITVDAVIKLFAHKLNK